MDTHDYMYVITHSYLKNLCSSKELFSVVDTYYL